MRPERELLVQLALKDLRVQQDQRVQRVPELPAQPVALVPRVQLAWLVKLALRAQQDQKV